jgi:hypothetical protein
VDAVLAPDFDNLAAVLPTRWLSGKDHSRLLGRSRPSWICGLDYRPPRAIRTKDEAIIALYGPMSSGVEFHSIGIQSGLCGITLERWQDTR